MVSTFQISEEGLKQVLDDFFLILNDKEKEVLTKRFALDNKPKQTLDKIGKHFDVTRERIRQIESLAIKKLKRNISSSQIAKINVVARKIILKHGRIIEEKELISSVLAEIKTVTPFSGNVTKLALVIDGDLERVSKPKEFHAFWKFKALSMGNVRKVARTVGMYLKKKKRAIKEEEILELIEPLLGEGVDYSSILSILKITPSFMSPRKGIWGLAEWRNINPKSIRDKAIVVLKKYKKPLHFIDIANRIMEQGFDGKSVTVQAVHNDLIRYDDFTLMGRGMYGLSSWGSPEGTVMDVIAMILKKNGPMKKQDVIKEVQKWRNVKEGTISLNLQKCEAFVRVGRAVYDFDESKWMPPVGGRGRAYNTKITSKYKLVD